MNDSDGVNVTDDSAIVPRRFSDIIAAVVNEAQFTILRGRTPRRFIKKRKGKGGKEFSYVPHGYVTAILNKAFGFDWDFEIVPQENGKPFLHLPEETNKDPITGDLVTLRKASIVVHARLTVRVRSPNDPTKVIATIVKTSTGETELIRGMTWGSAIKSAESDALKKAASRLGVALDLYWQDADEDYIPVEPPRNLAEFVIATRELGFTLQEALNKLNKKEMSELDPEQDFAKLKGP